MENGEGKRRWGDRDDAWRIRDIDGVHNFMAHLMPRRTEAEVYLHAEMDATALVKYINDFNSTGNNPYKLTVFHVFVAAITKTVKLRPKLNRYISGRRYYMRKGISLSFIAKKQFTDHAEEALMIVHPSDDYTLDTFARQIVGEVHEARDNAEYGADDALEIMAKLPMPVMAFVMWVLKVLSSIGLVPKSLRDVDTNHTTVLLSNLGSIKCDAAYHHLNNFGTNGIVITIGELKNESYVNSLGELAYRNILPVGMTVDERIADGFYFARSIKLLEQILSKPELLQLPLGEEVSYEY